MTSPTLPWHGVVLAAVLATGPHLVVAGAPLAQHGRPLAPSDIEAVLATSRADAAARTRFHAPYLLVAPHALVERVEVVTERRRLMLIAEQRLAAGDRMFTYGTQRALDALRPWRGRLSMRVRLHFPPTTAYAIAPPVLVRLDGPLGEVPRLDLTSETLFALASGPPGTPLPVVGATAEAVFDAGVAERQAREVAVVVDGQEIVRVPFDISRMP